MTIHKREDILGIPCSLCERMVQRENWLEKHYLGKHNGVDPPAISVLFELLNKIVIRGLKKEVVVKEEFIVPDDIEQDV